MRRLLYSAVLTLPFLVPIVGADAPAGQVLYTGKRQQPLPLSNVGDPAAVAKARLFVTTDEGKTWQMAHELQIAEGTKELPKFPFSVDHDGAFGIMPCITYRNGQAEPEPKPGQAPPYVLVVDTLAPVIAQFDATLVGRSTAKAVVRLTWSVTDTNPDQEPVAIEASSDGSRFITIQRGGLDGALEVTVPVAGDTKALQLRLLAKDRARNVTVSPSRDLSLEPMGEPPKPAAPTDPKDALAKAAATLPTLEEVGAVDPKPLPTTPIAPPSQENPTAPVAPKAAATTAAVATTPAAESAAAKPANEPESKPSPAATTIPSPRAEVVVDGKPYSAPVAPTPAGEPTVVIADNSIDQAYYEALAKTRPVAQLPNPKTDPRPLNQATPAVTAAPAKAGGDGRRVPVERSGALVTDEVKTLNDARVLATTGHLDDACDLYERLYGTSLGKTALQEEIGLLIAANRPRDALTAVSAAPLEIVTDPVRIEHGRLLLSLGRANEVEAAVAGVAGDAPEARPALLLIAKAYAAMGRINDSRKTLEWLARGKDAVASDARALLGR